MVEEEGAIVENEGGSGFDLGRLGERVRAARLALGLSLDEAAAACGVSRSMVSAVERGDKAPTVLILHRIATGLGTNITRLLGEEQGAPVVVLRREEQDVAHDPTGWERRNLAPARPDSAFEFMRTTIPPGVDAGEFPPHPPGSREYVAVEQGRLCLTVAGVPVVLETGDSIAYQGDCWHAFANPGTEPCVYYLALEVPARRPAGRPHRPQERPHV